MRREDEHRSDSWTCHENHAALCNTHDSRKFAAAVLQYCRYIDRGAVSRSRSAGCRRFCVFPDDLSDFHFAWAGDGKRNGIFHALWKKGSNRAERRNYCFVCAAWGCHGSFKCCRVPWNRLDHMGASYAGGSGCYDAGVSGSYFCRADRYFFVQFFCFAAAFSWKFLGAASVSGCFGNFKHSAGLMVCRGSGSRGGRCSGSYGDLPVCIRDWNCRLYMDEVSGTLKNRPDGPPQDEPCERNYQLFCIDLSAAVHYESWHPCRPGAGEQLWHHHHGGFCRSGKN